MEGSKFKDGDYVASVNIPDEITFQAVVAVCGKQRGSYTKDCYGGDITFLSCTNVLQSSEGTTEHTLDEWLFKNAPSWVVDIKQVGGEFYYSDGVNTLQNVFTRVISIRRCTSFETIATRTTVEGWYDYKAQKAIKLPPIGCKGVLYNTSKSLHSGSGFEPVEVAGEFGGKTLVVQKGRFADLADMSELRPKDYYKLEKEARDTWVENTLAHVTEENEITCDVTFTEALYYLLKSGAVKIPE